MTDRRGDPAFSVAPRSVGGDAPPGRRRMGRLGVVVVLLAAVAVIGVAWLGPRLASRPNFDVSFFATPTPSTSPSTSSSPSPAPGQTPEVTPLPAITLPDGVPQEGRVALLGDTLRILDLRTGDATVARPLVLGRDAVFADPAGDGWACICLDEETQTGQSGPTQVVRLERFAADGHSTGSTDLATSNVPAFTDFGQSILTVDMDLFPGRSQGLLATATRSGRSWEIAVRTVDIAKGSSGPPVVIGSVELPTPTVTPTPPPGDPGVPTDESSLDGPHLRIAPDGRSAFIWGTAQHFAIDTVDATVAAGWRAELTADGSVGTVTPAKGFAGMPMYCGVAAWASSDRFAWACPVDEGPDGPYHFRIQTIGPDGRAAGGVDLAPNLDGYFAEALFDRANGRIYVWDPITLTIHRVDVHGLAVDVATFDPAETAGPGGPDHGGSLTAEWHDGDSAMQMPLGQLAGSADGSRLYGVAIRPVQSLGEYAQGSNGVFVIDRATLALVDHWAPVAADVSVVTLPDGRVATSAVPGVDVTGRAVPWGGALTLRDPADGRVLARYGRLSQDMPPMILGR